eukprot:137172-Chlamydomonas_euryale.AAC.1
MLPPSKAALSCIASGSAMSPPTAASAGSSATVAPLAGLACSLASSVLAAVAGWTAGPKGTGTGAASGWG